MAASDEDMHNRVRSPLEIALVRELKARGVADEVIRESLVQLGFHPKPRPQPLRLLPNLVADLERKAAELGDGADGGQQNAHEDPVGPVQASMLQNAPWWVQRLFGTPSPAVPTPSQADPNAPNFLPRYRKQSSDQRASRALGSEVGSDRKERMDSPDAPRIERKASFSDLAKELLDCIQDNRCELKHVLDFRPKPDSAIGILRDLLMQKNEDGSPNDPPVKQRLALIKAFFKNQNIKFAIETLGQTLDHAPVNTPEEIRIHHSGLSLGNESLPPPFASRPPSPLPPAVAFVDQDLAVNASSALSPKLAARSRSGSNGTPFPPLAVDTDGESNFSLVEQPPPTIHSDQSGEMILDMQAASYVRLLKTIIAKVECPSTPEQCSTFIDIMKRKPQASPPSPRRLG